MRRRGRKNKIFYILDISCVLFHRTRTQENVCELRLRAYLMDRVSVCSVQMNLALTNYSSTENVSIKNGIPFCALPSSACSTSAIITINENNIFGASLRQCISWKVKCELFFY